MAQMQITADVVASLCTPRIALRKLSANLCPASANQTLRFTQCDSLHERAPGNICPQACDQHLATPNSRCRHRFAGARDSRAFAGYAVAGDNVLRRQLAHVFCVALCAPLVRSVERKVVCRFLPNHLPAPDSPVDCAALVCRGSHRGFHAGAVGCCCAPGGGRVPVRAALGR